MCFLTVVRPSPPTIQSTPPDSTTILGSEGVALTLTCLSTGGNPQQTVDWYRRDPTATLLTNCSTTPRHNFTTDLYDVTKTCTLTPNRSDDGATFFCQSSYNNEPRLVNVSEIRLLLNRELSITCIMLIKKKPMYVLTVSRPNSNMGHVGSKGRSPGQILLNSYLHSRDHSCDQILINLDQNACLNNI